MNKFLISILLLLSFAFFQEYEDVVYLKNGSIIRGMIIEQKPNKYIKIKSGINIFVYQMDEIDKITKEINIDGNKSNIANKTLSINLGLDENINFISIRKDFKIHNQVYFSLSAGAILNFINLGIKYEPNYNENGFSLLISSGFTIDSWGDPGITFYASPSYQWRFGKSNAFFNLGVMGGAWWDIGWGDLYPVICPIINFNFNF